MASIDANNAEKPEAAEEEQLVSNVTKTSELKPTNNENEKTQEDEADGSKGIQTTNEAMKSSHEDTHIKNSNSDKITDPQGNEKQGQGMIKFIDDFI